MPDLRQERDHLALADRHIAEAEARILKQRKLLAVISEQGHRTAEAENLLALLEQTLTQMHGHRNSILDQIKRALRRTR